MNNIIKKHTPFKNFQLYASLTFINPLQKSNPVDKFNIFSVIYTIGCNLHLIF